MSVENLTMEEMRQRILDMPVDDVIKYRGTLPKETIERYEEYLVQRARRILEGVISEDAREP
jgi:hypothetical protein